MSLIILAVIFYISGAITGIASIFADYSKGSYLLLAALVCFFLATSFIIINMLSKKLKIITEKLDDIADNTEDPVDYYLSEARRLGQLGSDFEAKKYYLKAVELMKKNGELKDDIDEIEKEMKVITEK